MTMSKETPGYREHVSHDHESQFYKATNGDKKTLSLSPKENKKRKVMLLCWEVITYFSLVPVLSVYYLYSQAHKL